MKYTLTTETAKQQAKHLATYLDSIKRKVSHGNALEAVAHMYGRRSWNVLSSELDAVVDIEQPSGAQSAATCFVDVKGERTELKVNAEVHSDDRRFEVDFDATPYFINASDEELLVLANADWGYDSAADEVACYIEGRRLDPEVSAVFTYLEGVSKNRGMYDDDIGFEVSVNTQDGLKYLRAFRYDVFVKVMLIAHYGSIDDAEKAGFLVEEDSDQPGRYLYLGPNGVGAETSYESKEEAYWGLGIEIEAHFKEWLGADADVLSVTPGSGELIGQAEISSGAKVLGRLDEETGAVLVMKAHEKALSPESLMHITDGGRFPLSVAVPVDIGDLIYGDVEALNDKVSETIAGSCADLVDLSYERHCPADEASLVNTSQTVYILVTAQWEPMDGFPEDDDSQD